eukprot:CFRG4563T1
MMDSEETDNNRTLGEDSIDFEDEDLDTYTSTSPSMDNWVLVANRLLLSTTCFMIYFLVVILSICQVIWTLIDPSPDTVLFWVLEAIIIGSLLVEMSIRFLAVGSKNYIRSWSNRFDMVVMLFMAISLGFYIDALHDSGGNNNAFIEEDAGLAVLVIRNVAQILRIFVLLKNSRASEPQQTVDFTRLREPQTHDTIPLTRKSEDDIDLHIPFAESGDNYDVYSPS